MTDHTVARSDRTCKGQDLQSGGKHLCLNRRNSSVTTGIGGNRRKLNSDILTSNVC